MKSLDDYKLYNPGLSDPLHGKVENLVRRMLDEAKGLCMIGYPFPMCINDLLPLAMGPVEFLMTLADEPDKCRQILIDMWHLWFREYEYFRKLIDSTQEGHYWSWPGMWSRDMVALTQSDMSCTIGPGNFEQFVCAELDLLGETYGTMWYHLDGPGAIKHLPALLAKPYMKIIQYVPGAGQPENGPHWIDLYKQVQAAGKGLDLDVPFENMEYLLKNLRPEGVVLRTYVESPEQAEELLSNAVKISGMNWVK